MTQNTGQVQEKLSTDMLAAFTGVSSTQLVGAVQALLDSRDDLELKLIEWFTTRPIESVFGFLFWTSVAFYLAERDINPKIKTFVDSLYYISTCMSVGYADIFAQTQTGRAVATLVMAVGPSLTNELLDPPHKAAAASAVGQEQMIERLDAILEELRKRPVME